MFCWWPHKYLLMLLQMCYIPDSKVHGANMGPIRGRQDPSRPHVGPMNFAIWDDAMIMTHMHEKQYPTCQIFISFPYIFPTGHIRNMDSKCHFTLNLLVMQSEYSRITTSISADGQTFHIWQCWTGHKHHHITVVCAIHINIATPHLIRHDRKPYSLYHHGNCWQ